jgi:Right handed beta helix region
MKILISLILLTLSIFLYATNYYISNSGSNANSGLTTSLPWQTIAYVNTHTFSPGDSILFNRGGTWKDSIVCHGNGISLHPIVYAAYGSGANPIITGFTTVSSWTNLGSNIWESASAISELNYINLVSINGVNTGMGRFPKFNNTDGGFLTFQTVVNDTTLISSSLTGTPNWTGAELVIKSLTYVIDRKKISSNPSSTITFHTVANWGVFANYGFFIQNDIRCCTQQNDWYYNSSTKKINVYSTSQPVNVNVPSVNSVVTCNTSYTTFKNLTFIGANTYAIYNPSTSINGLVIKNCSFNFSGRNAINVTSGNYTKVDSCIISDSNDIAVQLGSNRSYCEVKYCTITNSGKIPGMGYAGDYSGIAASNAKGLQLWNNRIITTGFNPITVWGDSILIKNNFVDTFCFLEQDGGGIYVARSSRPNGTEVNGNIVINGIGCNFGTPWTNNQAIGIYVDVWTDNYRIYNNSVANCGAHGIQVAGCVDTDIEGNTIYNCANGIYCMTGNETINKLRGNNKIRNNIFVCTQATGNFRSAVYHTYSYHTLDSMAGTFDFDYNVYSKPLMENNLSHYQWDETLQISDIDGPTFYSLAQWQAFSGKDLHSVRSPQGVSSTAELSFQYNDTRVNKQITLGVAMIDMYGNKYPQGTVLTLSPFTSKMLMNDHNPAPKKSKPVFSAKKIWRNPVTHKILVF